MLKNKLNLSENILWIFEKINYFWGYITKNKKCKESEKI